MQKIREVREAASISVKQLAEHSGIEAGSIYHYERGRRTPDFNTCWLIVNSLRALGSNCDFQDVFPNPLEHKA
ncbi:helix-turn-helix transcriptional regulator [Vibrio sp. JZG120]